MRRTDPQLKLRLPSALKEQIEQAAKNNQHSMNTEIINRLEQTVDPYTNIDTMGLIRVSSAFIVDALNDVVDRFLSGDDSRDLKARAQHLLRISKAFPQFSYRDVGVMGRDLDVFEDFMEAMRTKAKPAAADKKPVKPNPNYPRLPPLKPTKRVTDPE